MYLEKELRKKNPFSKFGFVTLCKERLYLFACKYLISSICLNKRTCIAFPINIHFKTFNSQFIHGLDISKTSL